MLALPMPDPDPRQCEERRELENRLAAAAAEVRRISNRLRAGQPGITADTVSDARKKAREAQAALRAHIVEHGCGPK